MSIPDATEKKVGDLIKDAQSGLADLLRFREVETDRWFMRLTAGRQLGRWKLLAHDSEKNDTLVREAINDAVGEVNDLVLAYVGTVEWRGEKQLMVQGQYFRKGHDAGVLFGSHLKRQSLTGWQPLGGFLLMGSCKNVWI